MCVIVEWRSELYALVVDDVGDVLWLPATLHEGPPATLSPAWRGLCSGLYRLESELLLVLQIEEVLALGRHTPARGALAEVEPTNRHEVAQGE
jgi:Chemotaxis signal transduction protein